MFPISFTTIDTTEENKRELQKLLSIADIMLVYMMRHSIYGRVWSKHVVVILKLWLIQYYY